MNPRQVKGKQIAKRRGQIKRQDSNHYKVKSQSDGKTYDVVKTRYGWRCSCPDYKHRRVHCKHIHAVKPSGRTKETKHHKIGVITTPICRFCGSDMLIKWGIRHNKGHNLQIYRCKKCSKKSTPNPGFESMKTDPGIIVDALELYFAGVSLRGIQRFLKSQKIRKSHVTIFNWIKKFIGMIDDYFKGMTPQVGDTWHADEVWIRINGTKMYVFGMMDGDTRFMLAHVVAPSKFKHDARSLLRTGRKAAGKISMVFVTDGLRAYHDAFIKEFWTGKGPRPKHIREIHIRNERSNNNIQERLNGEFRDREKTFRGLKKSDSPIITGITLYHNFIRPHMGLDGDTPADRAGIVIQGDNKWMTIIQNAAHASSGQDRRHPPST